MLCDVDGNLFEIFLSNFTFAGAARASFELGPRLAYSTIYTHKSSATMVKERSVEVWPTEGLLTNRIGFFESDFEPFPVLFRFASGNFGSPF